MTRMTAGLLVAGLVCGLAATTRAESPPSDACRQGYVWREAVPGDHVCVTPAIRQQAAEDNAQAGARRQPGGGAYGPNTCVDGYVWREARPDDVVCVTPETRVAICKGYNRWLADIWSQSNGRLTWAAVLPLSEMDEALTELEWASERGAMWRALH